MAGRAVALMHDCELLNIEVSKKKKKKSSCLITSRLPNMAGIGGWGKDSSTGISLENVPELILLDIRD